MGYEEMNKLNTDCQMKKILLGLEKKLIGIGFNPCNNQSIVANFFKWYEAQMILLPNERLNKKLRKPKWI